MKKRTSKVTCTMTHQHVSSCLAVPSRYVNVKKKKTNQSAVHNDPMYRDKWRILIVPVNQTELISKDKESIDNRSEKI
jgi:hypothetical protein